MTPRWLIPTLLVLVTAASAACSPTPPTDKKAGGCPDAPSSAAPTSAVAAPGSPVSVLSDATLPRIPLAEFARRAQPGGAPFDDHGIALGGIGSDMYPAQAPDEYWMVTDRGPNGQVKGDDGKVRTFPVPTFDPTILRVKLTGDTVSVEQTIPITTTDGRPVTGLSNDKDRDEPPYDLTGTQSVAVNPSGLDPEGLVRAQNGDFWLGEEYAPSILHLSPTGTVLARYVPEGLALPDPGYPVLATLPAILAKRQINRGFESLAISPDGGTLYTALQSPLALPDAKAGGDSRAVRLLALDPRTGRATAEYVYPFDEVAGFDPKADDDPSEMKLSALAWYGPDQLLVDERTDNVTKLYLVRIDPARNILGGPFDDPAHSPALEETDLAAAKPLTKTPLADLTRDVRGLPKKIEGVAVRDPKTIVVANDNDFGMTDGSKAFSSQGQLCDSGVTSRVLVLRVN